MLPVTTGESGYPLPVWGWSGRNRGVARLDLGGLWILVLVDHVLVDALIHQPVHLGFHPGLAERGKILAGVAIEHQLIMNDGVCVPRVTLGWRKLVLRHTDREIDGRVDVVFQQVSNRVSFMEWHRRFLSR